MHGEIREKHEQGTGSGSCSWIHSKQVEHRKMFRPVSRFGSLDRGPNEKSHSSLNDARRMGKTMGMDGTKECICIAKAPQKCGAFAIL